MSIGQSSSMTPEVTKFSATSFIMTTQKPRVNIEVSRMVESMLYELIPSLNKSKANRIARQLASFRAIRSLDSSTGRECLKLRLKKLSQKLLDVAERRRLASSSSAPTSRASKTAEKVRRLSLDSHQDKTINCHHILKHTVGELKYKEIISVSREMKAIRQQSAVWTKFSQQHPSQKEAAGDEEGGVEEEQGPASATLPAPIADIYFRNRLIDAMRIVDENTPKPYVEATCITCIIQQMEWETLLCDAQTKLAAFRTFEIENVKEGDDLSFRCGGMMCFSPPHCCKQIYREL